jgi:thioredoxin 1
MKESKWNGLLSWHAGERGDSRLALLLCLMLCIIGSKEWAKEASAAAVASTVERSCPGLSSGPLRAAHLAHLPKGVVLHSKSLQITQQQVTAEIQKAPERVRQQLGQNAFFVLEQLATRRLLLGEARVWAAKQNPERKGESEDALIRRYLQTLADRVSVGDEELRAFYSQNKELVGGAPFESVRDDLKRYLLGEKQQAAVEAHIHRLAERAAAEVDEVWTKQHCRLAMDNPVDKARRSGRATLVDFGATGCKPCDMMTPILAALKKKYAGRLNVLFVHVQEEQILATRYGVRTIPVQVFFDKEGKEAFRHEGFFPQAEIERKLTDMGIGK